ncbi:MAG: hypothetical protein AAF804_20065, partial [Bacteroidota bacterium]
MWPLVFLWLKQADDSICSDLFSLVTQYQETGDQQVVVQILGCVEGKNRRLSRLVLRMLPKREHKDDFLQDFFVRASQILRDSQIHENVASFIMTCAYRELLARIRGSREHEELDAEMPGEDPPLEKFLDRDRFR